MGFCSNFENLRFFACESDQIGAVESVKAASDIYAPVSGEVVEANAELEGSPSLINEEPYGQGESERRPVQLRKHHSFVLTTFYFHFIGWLCKLKISDESELSALMDEAAYEKHTAAE